MYHLVQTVGQKFLEKVRPRLTNRPAVGIMKTEKGTAQSGQPLSVQVSMYKKPSPGGVAVSAFYPDRYRISEDMERHSNRHCLTPFRELWLIACRLRSTQENYTGLDTFCQSKGDGCMIDATIPLFVQLTFIVSSSCAWSWLHGMVLGLHELLSKRRRRKCDLCCHVLGCVVNCKRR